MAEPFRRPDADCCALVADWVEACTGIDPAAAMRGAYSDRRGAVAIIRAAGGFAAMWRTHMTLAGFDETETPREGDVGVVRDAAGQLVAAIRFDGKWAAKTRGGLCIEDFPMVVAWSIPRA